MLGHIRVCHLSDLALFSWILTMTFLLIVSSMVMIGKNLASTIHLLKDSHILLSTESQLEPNLNHALLLWVGSVFNTAAAPSLVACASLALAKLNNILHGALAHLHHFFCHSFFLNFFFQFAYMCLAQFLCSARGAYFSIATRTPFCWSDMKTQPSPSPTSKSLNKISQNQS